MDAHLSSIRLDLHRPLEDANKAIRYVYFPDTGIISVVAEGWGLRQSEVGLIGREGMTGINVVMGSDRSPLSFYVLVAGQGLRVTADNLRHAMEKSTSLRNCFLRFAQAFMVQTAHTAVANGRANIEERLARWLLMVHDRLDGNELTFTHASISLMLNVRRAGVTKAMQGLSCKRVITTKRGQITVVNRPGLETAANGLYGVPEAEYRRLTSGRSRH